MDQSNCIFCDIVAGRAPASKVYEDERCVAFLDVFPLLQGHTLVIPKHHAPLMNDVPSDLRQHLLDVCQLIITAQKSMGLGIKAHNLLLNDGSDANQHVPHLHFHIIPRYGRDGLNW